jgi:hypothetical protein
MHSLVTAGLDALALEYARASGEIVNATLGKLAVVTGKPAVVTGKPAKPAVVTGKPAKETAETAETAEQKLGQKFGRLVKETTETAEQKLGRLVKDTLARANSDWRASANYPGEPASVRGLLLFARYSAPWSAPDAKAPITILIGERIARIAGLDYAAVVAARKAAAAIKDIVKKSVAYKAADAKLMGALDALCASGVLSRGYGRRGVIIAPFGVLDGAVVTASTAATDSDFAKFGY